MRRVLQKARFCDAVNLHSRFGPLNPAVRGASAHQALERKATLLPLRHLFACADRSNGCKKQRHVRCCLLSTRLALEHDVGLHAGGHSGVTGVNGTEWDAERRGDGLEVRSGFWQAENDPNN